MEKHFTLPISTEKDVEHAKVSQAILEWYDSWQLWQRKILITGIVNRYDKFQLHALLLAVESVFHKDFRSSVRKVYEVSKDARLSRKVVKSENIFKIPKPPSPPEELKKNSVKKKDDSLLRSSNHTSPEVSRISSPRIRSRTRTTSGSESDTSHPLSPIEENEIMTPSSNQGTLSRTSEATNSDKSIKSKRDDVTKVSSSEDKKSVLSEEITKSSTQSPIGETVESFLHLTPLGAESTVSLGFLSGITPISIDAADFFDECNPILGKPVTTDSMVLAKLQKEYDSNRNHVPIPAMHQLYKRKKFWNKKTIKTEVGRLKEQFREQLNHIWTWIDDWQASKRTRLLMMLFSKSEAKIIHYTAECLRQKTKEADIVPPPIDKLSDKLLLGIFRHLSSHDLTQVSYVCKHWYHLLASDEIWIQRCDMLGQAYNIPDLARLLASGAKNNQALDWRQAYIEVEEYMLDNLKLDAVESPTYSSSSEEDQEESEEDENKFHDYIPFWKLNYIAERKRSSRKSTAKRPSTKSANEKFGPEGPVKFEGTDKEVENDTSKTKGGFLEIWKNITEDLKEDLDMGDAHSDSCYAVDMFPDIQSWDDVGQLASIGQNFAVDFHNKDEIASCAKHWPIQDHVLRITKVEVLRGHFGTVNVVKAQGSRIFSGSTDRTIRVWDKNGECFAKMTRGLKGGVNDIFLGDGPNVIFTASWDMSVKIWNSVSFKLKETLNGHKGSVQKVVVDGKFIISCSHDGTIKVWNRASLKCEMTLNCHEGSVQCMIYYNLQIISGGIDKKIHVSSALTGRVVRTFLGHTSPITTVQRQHKLLASGDMEGFLYFWSLHNDDCGPINVIQAHDSQVTAICMHGRTFFTASTDALVKEWDLVTLTTLRICQGHTDAVMDVQWTDKYLITASRDNTVRRWWWETAGNEEEDEIVI